MRAGARQHDAWPLALVGITALGIALRVAYSLITEPPGPVGDPGFYHETARALADGHGYVGSHTLGTAGATAEHPPLYSLLVAGIDLLGGRSEGAQRLVASIVCGAAFIPLMGLFGRRVGGARAGLIAAFVAACWPTLIAAQASGESEALFGVFIALVLLSTYTVIGEPDLRGALWLGVWIGLATLTRSDAILLLAIPLILFTRLGRPRPWRVLGVTVAVTAVVLAPWVVRNWAEFGRPTLSTNLGTLVAGTNCPDAYTGGSPGSFRVFGCLTPIPPGNELDKADALTDRGLTYAREHASRLPHLFAVRFLNVWGLRDVGNEFKIYAAPRTMETLELIAYYPLLLLALAGGVLMRRRRAILWPLLIPPAITSLIAILSFGTARFRHASEVVIVVLAAVALDALWSAMERRRRQRLP